MLVQSLKIKSEFILGRKIRAYIYILECLWLIWIIYCDHLCKFPKCGESKGFFPWPNLMDTIASFSLKLNEWMYIFLPWNNLQLLFYIAFWIANTFQKTRYQTLFWARAIKHFQNGIDLVEDDCRLINNQFSEKFYCSENFFCSDRNDHMETRLKNSNLEFMKGSRFNHV